ncbi:TVP38/TMEM64 family protein [Nocardiopsis sediminis]|uniref:TVP38/TMEM64 family membrane protein n=1 Tax=Nocardiopsis sediminis TaxID=1778267 RepID=A0ABV8FL54_9ACTN
MGRPGVRWVVLAGWAAVVAAAGLLLPDVRTLRGWIEAAGPGAPAVFVVLYTVAVLGFFPRPLLSAAAGVLFAPVMGVAAALAGGVVSALVQFAIARYVARDAVRSRIPRTAAARLDRVLGARGVLAVVQLRLLPVIPFAVVNYGLGVTALRTRWFVLGTALGSLPATTALVLVGDSAADPWSPVFIACTVGLLLLTVAAQAAALLARRRSPAADAGGRTAGDAASRPDTPRSGAERSSSSPSGTPPG